MKIRSKKEAENLAKGLMKELYKIQQRWNAWEAVIKKLCGKSCDAEDKRDGPHCVEP